MLQTYGTEGMKRQIWNSEFEGGRWNCLDDTIGDCVYPVVDKYARGGAILDLGCGSGSTGNELPAGSYSRYMGVDISDAAIEKSKVRSRENGRSATNAYQQSDIFRYEPAQSFDVILFRDSIYYVPRGNVKAMLDRYATHLTPGGVFVVRIATLSDKYQSYLEAIEQHFAVVERLEFHQPDALVLVFRPAAS